MTEPFQAPPTIPQFDLADYAEHFEEMLRLKPMAAKYEAYKRRFKELADGKDELVLNGQVVATNKIAGKFQPTQLLADHPHIHSAYLRPVVVQEFDEESFKAHHPDLWKQYRSRTMLIKVETKEED